MTSYSVGYLQTVGVHDAPFGLAHEVGRGICLGDVEVSPHAAPGRLRPLKGRHPGLVVVHGQQSVPYLLLHLNKETNCEMGSRGCTVLGLTKKYIC